MKTSVLSHRIESFFADARAILGADFERHREEAGIARRVRRYSTLPASQLDRLCTGLNVTLETIVSGEVDYAALRDHAVGTDVLPQQYLRGSLYSSRFTGVYMFNFIRERRGEVGLRSILRRYQLLSSQFADVSSRNNILLPLDLCRYIQRYFGDQALEEMGASSLKLISAAPYAEDLRASTTPQNFFELFVYDLLPQKIERNMTWSIDRCSEGSVRLSGRLRPEVQELIDERGADPRPLESLRKGFIGSLPELFDGRRLSIRQLKSCSEGDPCDTYELAFAVRGPSERILQ